MNKIWGWRQWRLEDFYYLKLASLLEIIPTWEATICVPVKVGLGQFLPKDKRRIDRFVSLKKRGGLAMCLSFYWVRRGGQDFKNGIWDTWRRCWLLEERRLEKLVVIVSMALEEALDTLQRRCGLSEERCFTCSTKGGIRHTPWRFEIVEHLCLIVETMFLWGQLQDSQSKAGIWGQL